MLIYEKHINTVMICLQAAETMNRLWMAFDDNRRSLVPKNMHFFHFKREATAFCKENQRFFTEYKIAPVSRLLDIIKTIRGLQQNNELMPFNIQINSDMLRIQQQSLENPALQENSNEMKREHVLSDELLEEANFAFSNKEHWIAYNTLPYFLNKGDMYFFKTADEAHKFSYDNISDYDNYKVIPAHSVDELLKQIPYGERLEKQLTNPDANGLHNPDGNAFTDLLIEHIEQQQQLNIKNLSIMNEKNFDYLKDNLKYLGFGDKQLDALQANLKEGKESFQLNYSAEVNKKSFKASLQFRRSDSSEMYFLNSYKASLERTNGDTMEQTFYLNKGKGVTAKEAYNLLEGRAVHKELTNKAGEPYQAWIQLDFEAKDKHNNYEVKQFHEKYAYNLKEAVGKFPIRELDGGDKEKSLLQSLQKGNLQAVTLEGNGEGQRIFIEADPQYKTINVYNEKMQRLDQAERQNLMQRPEGKEVKQGKEKGKELGEEGQPKINKGKARNMSEDKVAANVGLIEKKRTATNKGLSI